MVVDVGGGTTETAVISLGGVVASHAIRCGGFDMDAAIQNYVRQQYGIAIGERTGEELKLAIGSALPYADEMKAEVRGREIASGLPKTVVLSPEEIRFALRDQVEQIVATVVACLGESPPELAQDIIYEGIHLVGGGALLRGLANRLADETEVPVHLVATPLECVVVGRRHVPRFVRQPTPHLRRRRVLSASAPRVTGGITPRRGGPRPPGAPASRDRRGTGAGPTSTEGPSNAARAAAARRRTAGLSPSAPSTAGRPAWSPMAPRAATAASRQSGSRWPDSTETSAARSPTAVCSPRSPNDHAVISTTEGSPSCNKPTMDTPSRVAASSLPRRRTVAAGSSRASLRSSSVRAPSRSRAPRAVARTDGESSVRPDRAPVSSPRWPARATRRRRSMSWGSMGPVTRGSAGPVTRESAGSVAGFMTASPACSRAAGGSEGSGATTPPL